MCTLHVKTLPEEVCRLRVVAAVAARRIDDDVAMKGCPASRCGPPEAWVWPPRCLGTHHPCRRASRRGAGAGCYPDGGLVPAEFDSRALRYGRCAVATTRSHHLGAQDVIFSSWSRGVESPWEYVAHRSRHTQLSGE